jgi:hypothetical protein
LAWGIISQGLPSEIRQTQWEALAQALFHGARRTMLGDDGNQIGAHSALRTLHSALEWLFSGIQFGTDDWIGSAGLASRLNPIILSPCLN